MLLEKLYALFPVVCEQGLYPYTAQLMADQGCAGQGILDQQGFQPLAQSLQSGRLSPFTHPQTSFLGSGGSPPDQIRSGGGFDPGPYSQ